MTPRSRRLLLAFPALILGASFCLALGGRLFFGSTSPGRSAPGVVPAGEEQPSKSGSSAQGFLQQLEQLRALGYVGEADTDLEQMGVVLREEGRVEPGINLYNPAHAAEAYLIDLEGRVLHRWALPLEQAFPEGPAANAGNRYWRRVRLLPGGDLLAIYEGVGLIRIDRNNKLRWARANGAHHDFDLTAT